MGESKGQKKKRAQKIIAILKKAYPSAACSLDYSNPLQLLVATILSAQCTDERVNKVTPALFERYKSAEDFANADIKELERYVRPTGFYKNKARNIQAACKIIVERFKGEVPRTMEEILSLPGVARKTANIVLGNAYGVVEGIAVDTHARRISYLLGLTKNADPKKIEKDLMELVPRNDWLHLSNLFVSHGRAVCIARRPLCSKCPVERLCPKNGLQKSQMR
ncbi:MAG: endonuclease III [Candidatus Micrarchaeota archaeon]|nr:endonuclease III [Candidatus Micrarchaeota archaeon]